MITINEIRELKKLSAKLFNGNMFVCFSEEEKEEEKELINFNSSFLINLIN